MIGVPASGRLHRNAEGLVGCFTNTLPVRQAVDGQQLVGAYLEAIHRALSAALDHQGLPFAMIRDALGANRRGSYHPVFQWMFGLNRQAGGGLALPGVGHRAADRAPFGLTVRLQPVDHGHRDGYVATWEYASALYDTATIEQFGSEFLHVLEQLVDAPARGCRTSACSMSPASPAPWRWAPGRRCRLAPASAARCSASWPTRSPSRCESP